MPTKRTDWILFHAVTAAFDVYFAFGDQFGPDTGTGGTFGLELPRLEGDEPAYLAGTRFVEAHWPDEAKPREWRLLLSASRFHREEVPGSLARWAAFLREWEAEHGQISQAPAIPRRTRRPNAKREAMVREMRRLREEEGEIYYAIGRKFGKSAEAVRKLLGRTEPDT